MRYNGSPGVHRVHSSPTGHGAAGMLRRACQILRPRRVQLRTQVLAGVLSITLIALAAFDLAAVGALHRYLLDQTKSRLQTAITATQPQLADILPVTHRLNVLGVQAGIPGAYDIEFVPTGAWSAVHLEDGAKSPATIYFAQSNATHRPAYTAVIRPDSVAVSVRLESGTLIASTSLGEVNATLRQFKVIVIVGSAAVGLLIFLGIVLVMRRGLRPIETMATQADRITAGDLNHRVSLPDTRSEVGRLGTALNGMLARIEADVDEREVSQRLMRQFFADASHELRTPLASLRANAELYQQGALRQRPQVDEAMRRIALEAQRMSGLVDDMLRLARLDQHPARQQEPVDLSALIDDCVQRAQVADPRRSWRPAIAPGLVADGDEELLRRAIDNILANVRTHTQEGAIARITAAPDPDGNGDGDGDGDGDTIVIEVSDDGPGVPDEQLPRIFDRFYRAGAPTWRPGSGLGLAIVAEIAKAHQGTAQAQPNIPRGLRITLTLPASAVSECGDTWTDDRPAARAEGPHRHKHSPANTRPQPASTTTPPRNARQRVT